MATDTDWQLEKEYYTISQDHDLVVRVIEYEEASRTQLSDGLAHEVKESVPSKVHEFKVKREVLTQCSAYFLKLIRTDGPFKERGQDRVDLHEDPAGSLDVWFKILHDCDLEPTYANTSVAGVWEMLATAHKYGFDPKTTGAKSWFAAWYKANKNVLAFDYEDHQSLLFPCYTFDYPEGFKTATKYLVYEARRHITERKPEGFFHDHLRMDANVMQQLNAAKGRLKTILHRGLYDPIDKLLKQADCNCKEKTLFAYEKSLSVTQAWPLETAFLKDSVNEILAKLNRVPGTNAQGPQTCRSCSFNFHATVSKAIADTGKYFDGLCLDCMNASKSKLGDADEDYWSHTALGVPWDQRCRIRHGQPSWYFSFLGRREKIVTWNKEKHN